MAVTRNNGGGLQIPIMFLCYFILYRVAITSASKKEEGVRQIPCFALFTAGILYAKV
ncbi:hypothetical protein A2U01_0041036, partial [Trifolium medium]|nr:hypothetical protein [Trifolium medium]